MQLFEASIAGKWLSMLKEIAPQLRDPSVALIVLEVGWAWWQASTGKVRRHLSSGLSTSRVASSLWRRQALAPAPRPAAG
jgi:hypothetical protein